MAGSKNLAQRLQESHLQVFHFAVEGLSLEVVPGTQMLNTISMGRLYGKIPKPKEDNISMGRFFGNPGFPSKRTSQNKFHPMVFVRSVKESIPSPEVNVYILKSKPWISNREIIYLPVIITQQLKLIHLVRWFVQLYILL